MNALSLICLLLPLNLAEIFYQLFPSLLDIEKNQYVVAFTSKQRTNETAQSFVRALVEIQRGNQSDFKETVSRKYVRIW